MSDFWELSISTATDNSNTPPLDHRDSEWWLATACASLEETVTQMRASAASSAHPARLERYADKVEHALKLLSRVTEP